LITVSGRGGAERRFYRKAEEAIGLNMENVRKGPAFLLHLLLDDIVDNKFIAIEAIQDEIDGAEERVLEDTNRFQPGELLHLRRYLLMLRKSLFHEREIMVKICRRDSPFISEKSIYHFRDIYDHLAKFFEAIEINREMITDLMEMYLSIINNQMAMMANKTNRTVRLLTLITTVFMPLTLLAGIGGMSEWTMMTGVQHWKIAYPLFLLGLAVLGIANYVVLRWAESRFDDPRK
jgi:magnesium transporter